MRTASRTIRCVVVAIALLIGSGVGVGTDLSGRHARRGQRRAGRRSRRRGHARQRGHQRGPRGRRRTRSGEYSFPSVLPGTYTVRVALAGFRTEERTGLPHRHAADRSPWTSRSRWAALAEQITVTRRRRRSSSARRASVATTMTAAQITAIPLFGRNTFYTAIATPERHPVRRPAVRPLSGSVGRVAAVARRRPAPRQRLPDRRRVDHRLLNRASWVPSTEGGRGHEGAAQDLRRRDGPRRRRRVQRHRQVRLERLARQRAVHEQAGLGHRPAVLRQARRHAQSAAVLLLVGRLGRRPDQSRTARSSGSARTTTCRRARATTCSRSRRCASAPATSRSRASPSTTR